jgi:dTDP-4-dehydrorhamnose reductase
MERVMILVIGSSGQLAKELKCLMGEEELVAVGRHDIDVTKLSEMSETLNRYQPSAIINAAAYTAVDKAEIDQENAYLLNQHAVANLAHYAANNHCHLVHVSSDYVFDGAKGSPYLVGDKYNPQGVYGASKAAGEKAMQPLCTEHACILRTSWVYSQHGNNFVKTMLRLMSEKPELGVIDDQIGSPTSAKALAEACLYAAQHKVTGIHHFTDAGVASWYDFAVAIQRQALGKNMLNSAIPIRPIPSSAYPTPAKRPSYSVLDKCTLKEAFNGLQPKHWQTELDKVLEQIKSNTGS